MNELRKIMEQSAGGLILRVWMEVRKIFIEYLCTSKDSPFYPVDAIFQEMNIKLMLVISLIFI